jgi:hypothetical protein
MASTPEKVHVLHKRPLTEIADELGRRFAERAPAFDETDTFCEDNYVDLKEAGLVEAGVPGEFGGGGARRLSMPC